MFDSHAHLEDDKYNDDRDKVIKECQKKMTGVVTVCSQPSHLDRVLDMTKKYKGFVFAAAGIHPEFVEHYTNDQKEQYFERVKEHAKEIVAIGETGLDYHWVTDPNGRKKQKQWFLDSIELAQDLKKPLVIHSRKAHEATLEILLKQGAEKVQWHMFSSKPLFQTILDQGWMISVGAGILHSKPSRIVRDIPLEQLMTETDAPYVAPTPGERNTPLTVELVIKKIAEIRKEDSATIDRVTTANAKRHFDL
ncbi:MAG: TatD family hydrolase [Nanoarchaeota archaeon]|nr:TatD family hydrolase [Nanoarchaeota archaeon]